MKNSSAAVLCALVLVGDTVKPRSLYGDLLTAVEGRSAPKRFTRAALGPVMVDVIGREAFIKNKRATGRAKDLGDIESLGGA
jgi:hypothetical protein